MTVAAVILALWTAWAVLCAVIRDNPRGDFTTGVLYHLIRLHARAIHRLRVAGARHLPSDPGPLIVVSNHTAGVDPLLIQAACPFEVRWMMGADMMVPAGRALWEHARVIPVDRARGDSAALRDAIRHLRAGGVLGVFPEGGIETPPGTPRPFEPGLGLLIARTGATTLPVVVDGTPRAVTAWGSLFTPSRSRVTFHEPIPASALPGTPPEIVADLEARYRAWM
ncbi:MAG: 1-acyl-sn-glycerol-3-phosphate acyltransferase [Phycisphaerae bacterium]|nr:1-acyl-sn-glycerol-3-phosphate acyltransferase [Phycisphaerae bacterium]